MNISNEIMQYAGSCGLDTAGTGGGFDYVVRRLGSGERQCELVLCSLVNRAMSPSSLDEPSEVGISFHASGYNSVGIHFATAKDAMDFMAKATEAYFLPHVYKDGLESGEGFCWS